MRQLSLFGGKRQRGVKPPPPLEFHTHVALADIVRRWINPQWRFTHIPLGELRDKATAARLHRMGVRPGWPDFVFIGPGRATFWLELKRRGTGRFTDEQADVAAVLCAGGHDYLATDDLKDAVATLKALGIVRRSIEVQ